MSSDPTTNEEAANLAALFKDVPNKAAFAREFKVPGGASMISQHLSGHRPMNLTAATAYARGFGVPLSQISKRLAAMVDKAQTTADTPDTENEKTTQALKAKLKDWRMHASPRSVQVIDQLTVLAERDALREDDWTLIETMARRLKTAS